MRFKSKPVEVEAVQWRGDNWEEIHAFACEGGEARTASTIVRLDPDSVYAGHPLQLLAGQDGAQEWVPVPVGHWIVRRADDWTDFWPVDPTHFDNRYEAV